MTEASLARTNAVGIAGQVACDDVSCVFTPAILGPPISSWEDYGRRFRRLRFVRRTTRAQRRHRGVFPPLPGDGRAHCPESREICGQPSALECVSVATRSNSATVLC